MHKTTYHVSEKKVSLTPSSKLTIAALLGMAVVHLLSTLILNGEYPLFALVIELPLVVLTALAAMTPRIRATVQNYRNRRGAQHQLLAEKWMFVPLCAFTQT